MATINVAEIPKIDVDPVTLDIIEGALKSTRFEMDATLFRTAMSPVIREQHDEFPMITDPHGRMVVGQFGSYISEMLEGFDEAINEGDVIFNSDPYKCGGTISHINDWLVCLPIFWEGELIGWASMFGHQMDAGGPLPGSLPTGAKTVFGEGIRIPPVKIFRAGELNKDVLDVILNNVRMPEMNRADLMGIIAGCRTAEKRIHELCERFGRDTYLAACQALLDRTFKAMAKLIVAAIPEEPQSFEDWIDDDGLGHGPYKMKLTIWREGEHAYFDWSGTDPQAMGPVNFYLSEGHVQDVHRGLPDHGLRPPDPLQRRLLSAAAHRHPGRLPAAPEVPVRARLPHARADAAVRHPRRRACAQEPRAHDRRGYGTSPYMLYSAGTARASSTT
jgi:N-methylhydantoinase B